MRNTFGRWTARVGMLVAMAVLVCHTSVAFAGTILGSAQSFAILGASTVTNTGASTISGDVGVYPGTSITGFGTVTLTGTVHATDAVAFQAQNDERFAYNALALLPFTTNETGTDLAGQTLTPGVYRFSSDALLSGALTLDFGGIENELFVFQIGSALTTASGASVNVIGSAVGDGIFWQVGSSATLGTSTSFAGNILALTSVALDTTASITCGRAFAQTGAVTLQANTVSSTCGANDFGSGPTDFNSAGFSPTANIQIVSPEPGSFLLLGIGLLGFVVKYSARGR